jgi:uncharacterized protein YfaS (alpha-2-macroglobulin family)
MNHSGFLKLSYLKRFFFVFLFISIAINAIAQAPASYTDAYFKKRFESVDSLKKLNQYNAAYEAVKEIKVVADQISHTGYRVKCFRDLVDIKQNYLIEEDQKSSYEFILSLFSKELQGVSKWQYNARSDYRAFLLIEKAAFLKSLYNEVDDDIYNDTSIYEINWSKERILKEIWYCIDQSMLYAQNFNYNNVYKPIIKNYFDSFEYTPSLLSIIALEGIEILGSFDQLLKKEPEISDSASVFAPCKNMDFETINFDELLSNQLFAKVLNLYQIVFSDYYHVYFDIERLKFVNKYYQLPASYMAALKGLYSNGPETPYLNLVALEMAEQVSVGRPTDAVKILNEALEKRPGFKQNTRLFKYRYELEKPDIKADFEMLNTPDKKALFSVNYKNTDTAYIKIYKVNYIDYTNKTDQYYYGDEKLKRLKNFINGLNQPLHSLSVKLIDFKDLKFHTLEMQLPKLESGVYLISVANRNNWEDTLLQYSIASININKNVFVEKSKEMYLLSANNGAPQAGVKVNIWKFVKDAYQLQMTVTTSADGKIVFPTKSNDWYQRYIFETSDKNLYYFHGMYKEYNYQQEPYTSIRILTDRAIYRPGQKVFFKCIVTKSNQNVTVPKFSFTIQLFRDGELLKKKLLISNTYGSCSSEFLLPTDGMASGNFSLSVDGKNVRGYTSFKVEEYKLAKFTAQILPSDTAYKLNDHIHLQGKAMALAGYPVSGAKVTYTVKREAIFYNYYYYKGGSFDDPEIVKSAETITSEDGSFELDFLAVVKERKPNNYYVFTISGTVADINGEVRSFTKSIELYEGDRIAELMTKPENLNNQDVVIQYKVKNTEGVALPFTGKISILKLDDITELKKSRFWKSDTTLLSEADYRMNHSDYLPGNYQPDGQIVMTKQFVEDIGTQWQIDQSVLNQSGRYLAILECKDGSGNLIKVEKEFMINEALATKCTQQKAVQMYSLNGNVFEPGKTARIAIASGIRDQYVMVEARSNRGLIYNKMLLLNESIQVIEIPVLEKDRGNILFNVIAISHYRQYKSNLTLQVPYTNKQLVVKVKSFRNNIEPGSKEKWVLSLTGPASEKAAMELAAVMYDASLDEIEPHNTWNFGLYSDFNYYFSSGPVNYISNTVSKISINNRSYSWLVFNYPKLDLSDKYQSMSYYWRFGDDVGYGFHTASISKSKGFTFKVEDKKNELIAYDSVGVEIGKGNASGTDQATASASVRKNFNETAFFFPHLYASKNGEITIEFTMPDALSKWRMHLLAHSTTMQLGYHDEYITTSKKLMIQPNMPRFLRQNERIVIASKIINTSNESIDADVKLIITDVKTGNILNWSLAPQRIQLDKNAIKSVAFPVSIPDFTGLVQITISAGNTLVSDAEEHTLLVLSNRTLVQTSMPISIRKAGPQSMDFKALLKNQSTTLVHQSITAEMCSNPSWYAVMALPYMMEYPNECAEQLFTRLYGNLISQYLSIKYPEMKKVFSEWIKSASVSKSAVSPLHKNEDLKTAALTETPWLMEADNETERIQQLGRAFESAQIQKSITKTINKLRQMQASDGGFPWFAGMESNVYITQTIVIGLGKLKSMGIDVSAYDPIISKAIKFIDQKAQFDYDRWIKDTTAELYPISINYLYAKMAFPEYGFGTNHQVVSYYLNNAETNWNQFNYLNKAQLAVILKAMRPASAVPGLIIKSFDDMAVRTDEMGMYWPENISGWYWYKSPVETQAAIIEAYYKVSGNLSAIREQQIWLMRQKQTQSWASTRSTADACFAILNYNQSLSSKQSVSMSLGTKKIEPQVKQAGTGYYTVKVPGSEVTNEMGNVTIKAETSDFAYGALHWQYFEYIDKVQKQSVGLSIIKNLYVYRTINGKQEKWHLGNSETLRVGDVLEVVMVINSDRDLEFVHVKDLRASGTEPADVLSEYHWKNGIGYYQVTRDVSSNFFIDYMPKGNHRISYLLYVQQAGEYSSGIATAQCMYAPEFIANSESTRLKVE